MLIFLSFINQEIGWWHFTVVKPGISTFFADRLNTFDSWQLIIKYSAQSVRLSRRGYWPQDDTSFNASMTISRATGRGEGEIDGKQLGSNLYFWQLTTDHSMTPYSTQAWPFLGQRERGEGGGGGFWRGWPGARIWMLRQREAAGHWQTTTLFIFIFIFFCFSSSEKKTDYKLVATRFALQL